MPNTNDEQPPHRECINRQVRPSLSGYLPSWISNPRSTGPLKIRSAVGCTAAILLMLYSSPASSADNLHIRSLSHGHAAIETQRISQDTFTIAPAPGRSAAHGLPVTFAPAPSRQQQILWDAYVDATWSILGGDVAQSLALAVQDIQKTDGSRLQIEAYCDDRDSSAYSLVIGDRWLTRVEAYLVELGASAPKLTRISFGKERLLCHETTGECWEANLRLHESFRLMAIDQANEGCLIRVMAMREGHDGIQSITAKRRPTLQRLHVSLPVRMHDK